MTTLRAVVLVAVLALYSCDGDGGSVNGQNRATEAGRRRADQQARLDAAERERRKRSNGRIW